MAVGTFILVSGRIGDVFGYKRMLVIGYLWFAVWSIVAGLAVYSNYVLFVLARALQGIGPAICLPNGLALLGAIYSPGPRKNMAFAAFGACAPSGSLIGAALSSIFAEFAWWPWTYWTFGMVLAVIAGGSAWLLPNPQPNLKILRSFKAFIDELDLTAAAVGVTSLVLFNASLSMVAASSSVDNAQLVRMEPSSLGRVALGLCLCVLGAWGLTHAGLLLPGDQSLAFPTDSFQRLQFVQCLCAVVHCMWLGQFWYLGPLLTLSSRSFERNVPFTDFGVLVASGPIWYCRSSDHRVPTEPCSSGLAHADGDGNVLGRQPPSGNVASASDVLGSDLCGDSCVTVWHGRKLPSSYCISQQRD